MANIIGFVGYESEDIVLYLAKVLYAFEKRVAIVDRTEQEMLLELLEVGVEREGEYEGIWVTSQGVEKEKYDIVFLLFGYRFMHPKLYECEFLIMVTDGVPAHASLLRKIGQWERVTCLIIRNLVEMKYGEQYLKILTGQTELTCFMIPYEEQDIRIKYCLGSDTEICIKKLSKEMKQTLIQLVLWLFSDYSENELKKKIRKL